MRPCAITHYGLCNALGRNTEAVLSALFGGRVGLTLERPFPSRSPAEFVTPLGRTDLNAIGPFAFPNEHSTRQDALASLGLRDVAVAARSAVTRFGAARVAVILGTSTGGIESSEHAYAASVGTGDLPRDFSLYEHHALDAAARRVAASIGATGPVFAVSTACSSSSKALASASRLLSLGFIDAALVGGVDSLCLLTLMGFHSLGVVDPVGCRPFAADRRGMNIGEGAAFLLLEREARAAVYLVGSGETNDAHHMAHPHPNGEGAERAIALALADAGLDASRIDYVNAHGTGTQANDGTEAAVLSRVFGHRPLVSSTKGYTGHLLGASGTTEAAFCAAAILRQMAPGNREVDNPELGLRLCPTTRPTEIRFALSNAFAFGGSNAALLLCSEEALAHTRTSAPNPIRWVSLGHVVDLREDEPREAEAALLSARALGRASPLTVLFTRLLSRLSLQGVDVKCVPQVFASAYGEMHTTLQLLDMQVRRGESSPLRFQHSVHNAAQGVLSIALSHRGFSTSISAGRSTFAMALVEAFGLFAAGHREVVVLLAEEPAPKPLSTSSYEPIGVGLHLVAERGDLPRLSLEHGSSARGTQLAPVPAPLPEYRQSPLASALCLGWLRGSAEAMAISLNGHESTSTTSEPEWILHYHPASNA